MGPRAVRYELLGVTAVVMLVAVCRSFLPRVVPLGVALIAGALLLLAQGFLRDLARLVEAKRSPSERKVTCVCVESVIGLGVIVAGVGSSLAWTATQVHVGPLGWPIGVGCVCLFGTLTREIVFDWRALRLRREPDHGARVVWRE